MTKKILLTILLLAMGICFAGCQTVQGFGGDVKWTGEQLKKAAE
jgi:predicted small secreted protein